MLFYLVGLGANLFACFLPEAAPNEPSEQPLEASAEARPKRTLMRREKVVSMDLEEDKSTEEASNEISNDSAVEEDVAPSKKSDFFTNCVLWRAKLPSLWVLRSFLAWHGKLHCFDWQFIVK